MRKAKYNYYGHLSLGGQVAMLIMFCIVLALGVSSWKLTEIQEKLTFLLIMCSFAATIFWIGKNLGDNLKRLEMNEEELIFTSLLSKAVERIELKKVAGFKINGLTLKTELIDLQGEVIAKVHSPFYKELDEFFLEKNIKQIGINETYLRGLTV